MDGGAVIPSSSFNVKFEELGADMYLMFALNMEFVSDIQTFLSLCSATAALVKNKDNKFEIVRPYYSIIPLCVVYKMSSYDDCYYIDFYYLLEGKRHVINIFYRVIGNMSEYEMSTVTNYCDTTPECTSFYLLNAVKIFVCVGDVGFQFYADECKKFVEPLIKEAVNNAIMVGESKKLVTSWPIPVIWYLYIGFDLKRLINPLISVDSDIPYPVFSRRYNNAEYNISLSKEERLIHLFTRFKKRNKVISDFPNKFNMSFIKGKNSKHSRELRYKYIKHFKKLFPKVRYYQGTLRLLDDDDDSEDEDRWGSQICKYNDKTDGKFIFESVLCYLNYNLKPKNKFKSLNDISWNEFIYTLLYFNNENSFSEDKWDHTIIPDIIAKELVTYKCRENIKYVSDIIFSGVMAGG
jgi:hypothetical protein